LRDLRDANKGLDTAKFSTEKSITEYMLKNQALMREMEDKEQIIGKQNALIEQYKNQMAQMDQDKQ